MPIRRSLAPALALGLALVAATPAVLAAGEPPSPPLTRAEVSRRDATEHFLKARLLAADGEFTEALKEFRLAVDLDPSDGHLRREYAETLYDVQIFPEAEREARKAVELLPGNAPARRTLGQILLVAAKDKAGVEAAAAELRTAVEGMPGEPEAAVAYARALLRLDRPKDAARSLEKVLDRGRGFAIPLLYAEALEKSDQLDTAEEVYRSVLRQDPDSPAASLGLLRVYERGRQWEKAAPLVEELVKRQPRNLALRTQYGMLLFRARRFDDALAILREVLAADPGNREALRGYAAVLSDRQETDKADEVLRKLQELDPDDPEIALRRGLNLVDARRLDEAEKILREARSLLVARKAPKADFAPLDGQLGYVAFLKKDYSGARSRLLPHLFGTDGVNPQALNLLLQVARDENDPAEGLRLSREAVAKGARGVGVQAALGEFLIRSGASGEKVEGEKALAELAAGEKPGILAAADAWQRMERHDRAADVAAKGLERYPADPEMLFRLGASLERQQKREEAVKAFEQLLALRPDHAAGLNYLGYMWAERGENLPRARDMIEKAVRLEPGSGAYLDSLGWVWFRIGDLEKSEKFLRDAARLTPDDPTIEEHLGDLLERKGDLAGAREHWKRSLELKPEDGGARARERLTRTGSVPAEAHR